MFAVLFPSLSVFDLGYIDCSFLGRQVAGYCSGYGVVVVTIDFAF